MRRISIYKSYFIVKYRQSGIYLDNIWRDLTFFKWFMIEI